jgi:hypothetical protein
MTEQLSLFDLLDDLAAGDRRSLPRRTHRGADGPGRLLRALVRDGLDEDALVPAAALVLALDVEAGEKR